MRINYDPPIEVRIINKGGYDISPGRYAPRHHLEVGSYCYILSKEREHKYNLTNRTRTQRQCLDEDCFEYVDRYKNNEAALSLLKGESSW